MRKVLLALAVCAATFVTACGADTPASTTNAKQTPATTETKQTPAQKAVEKAEQVAKVVKENAPETAAKVEKAADKAAEKTTKAVEKAEKTAKTAKENLAVAEKPADVPPGRDGEVVFKTCVVCHGPKAEKVYLNKVKPPREMAEKEIVQALKDYKAGSRNVYQVGALMSGNAKTLSEGDMYSVAKYIKSL
ncbi:MAG: c-type cytochrome [Helicobacteraceae bacterium]|jgi:cytochrome c|nr:c-type cytochrome [Helicobacteraceae bacterium]